MPAIKPIDQIAEKWERVTPGRVTDYVAGVRNPRRNWMEATLEQAEAYIEALTQALQERRWERGVEAAGNAKWQRNTIEKGPQRWGQGVRVAVNDYSAGFRPYRDEIEATDLPPRGPKGDPRNLERVRILNDRLHALKLRIG